MTDAIIPGGTQIDSLRQNEFEVHLEGQVLKGIFSVSGLVTFKLDIKPSQSKLMYDPITLVKMVQRDPELPFNKWLRETVAAGDDIQRPSRALAIVALDDGIEIRRWTLNGAWISAIAYSTFSPANVDLVEETLTIHYQNLSEAWAGA
ncbi:MAG: phage tail protein [Chloroflexota bacterium]|nr:phage tail protein [Chloroflexota bacterium]